MYNNFYILKGIVKNKTVYFVGFQKRFVHGKEILVNVYSDSIVGATVYDNYKLAKSDCNKLPSFQIYFVCPICNNEYLESHNESPNKTSICPTCKLEENSNRKPKKK